MVDEVMVMAQGDDGTVFVAVPLEWVQGVTAMCNRYALEHAEPPTQTELLQAAADQMRDSWRERFPQLSENVHGVVVDQDGDGVIFTPYGYRKEREVHDEAQRSFRREE